MNLQYILDSVEQHLIEKNDEETLKLIRDLYIEELERDLEMEEVMEEVYKEEYEKEMSERKYNTEILKSSAISGYGYAFDGDVHKAMYEEELSNADNIHQA